MYPESERHDLDWFSLLVGTFVAVAALVALGADWAAEAVPWLNAGYVVPAALLGLGSLGLVRSLRGHGKAESEAATEPDFPPSQSS